MKCSMHHILSGVDRRALHAMLTSITPPWTGNLIVSCPCCMLLHLSGSHCPGNA